MNNRNAVNTNPKQPDQKVTVPQIPTKDLDNPPLEAAKGNDEVMSQPPEPKASPWPKADKLLKHAAHETAQEPVHEVMSKIEAKNLIPVPTQKVSIEKGPWESKPGK